MIAPATPAPGTEWIGPKQWLMDTGSAVDLVSVRDVPKAWRHEVVEVSPPVELSTANGLIKVKHRVPLQVGPLPHDVEPLLLPSTPSRVIRWQTLHGARLHVRVERWRKPLHDRQYRCSP